MADTSEVEKKDQASWVNQLPNILTVFRIVLVPIFIGFVVLSSYYDFYTYHVSALIVFCVAAYTDRLDGQLARRWNLVTKFGKLVDPIADKALMLSAFVLLSIYLGLFWWFTVIVILRELAVTILRMVLLRRGIVVPASQGGKIKTALQVLLVFMWMLSFLLSGNLEIIFAWSTLFVLVATFLVTVLTGLTYFLDAWTNYRTGETSPETSEQEILPSEKNANYSDDTQGEDKLDLDVPLAEINESVSMEKDTKTGDNSFETEENR